MSKKELAAFLNGLSIALMAGWVVGEVYPTRSLLPLSGVALTLLLAGYVFDKRSE